jgi:hypothetical protein
MRGKDKAQRQAKKKAFGTYQSSLLAVKAWWGRRLLESPLEEEAQAQKLGWGRGAVKKFHRRGQELSSLSKPQDSESYSVAEPCP